MKFILVLLIIALSIFCSHCTNTTNGNDSSLSIEFPLNKKSVYAVCSYNDFGDSLSLENIEISSLLFEYTYSSGDTIYLLGTFSRNSDSNSAPISVAIIDNWILFEYSEISDAGLIFLKSSVTTINDTTSLPDLFHNHFPLIPHNLETNSFYTITRPANSADEWGYAEVTRIFDSKGYKKWVDVYDENSGIEVILTHKLLGFEEIFSTIFDSHGLVNSQWSYNNYIMNEEGEVIDSVTTHRINRRIVDYTEPSNVNDLVTYFDLVRENGLTIIK